MRLTWALALLVVCLPGCARGGSADFALPDAGVRMDAGPPEDAATQPTDSPLGVDAGLPPACVPSCGGAVCGDDGCGGSCGTCTTGSCVSGACSCAPDCSGRTCGDDGCGGSCGTCGSLCTDTCTYSSDLDCDDGGPLSDFSLCDLGTDCSDCGPRTAVCSGGTCVSP